MWSKHLKLDVQEEFSSGEIETKNLKKKEQLKTNRQGRKGGSKKTQTGHSQRRMFNMHEAMSF